MAVIETCPVCACGPTITKVGQTFKIEHPPSPTCYARESFNTQAAGTFLSVADAIIWWNNVIVNNKYDYTPP